MRTFDLTPLFRSSVGFDRLNDLFESALRDDVPSYPPYNIEKLSDDHYRISMAVAGFKPEDISIIAHKNVLKISARVQDNKEAESVSYLYKGIANRSFERTFNLADYMEVKDASLTDGLLRINLARVIPEEDKPRQIAITASEAAEGKAKTIESKKVA